MNDRKHRKVFAFIITILFVCGLFACSMAEETENALVPEETETDAEPEEELVEHCLWGFFVGWAEGDTARMLRLCTTEWKHGKADPGQELLKLLGSGKPRGYRVNSISGKENEPVRTINVTVQQETENGEFTYSVYEIPCRSEAETDMYLGFNPDGFGAGVSAEPVPEEDLVVLTAEGMIRDAMELYTGEGLPERMIPVNAVTEKQGIRVEVLAGLAREDEEWFLVSVEDTEGRYRGTEMEPSFESDGMEAFSCQWSRVYSEGNRAIYMICRKAKQPLQPGTGDIMISIPDIRIRQTGTVSLRPLLDQYGGTEEGVPYPEPDQHTSNPEASAVPEDMKVLDYHTPMDLPLYGDLCLAGIAWIGDQLHVQLHQQGTEYIDMANGRSSSCFSWVELSVYGKPFGETEVEYSPLHWDGNDNGWSEWTEYIFNCKPEDTEQIVISAEITRTTAILEDSWKILIPRDTLRVTSGT